MSVFSHNPIETTPARLAWIACMVIVLGAGCAGSSSTSGSSSISDTRVTPLQGGAARPLSAFRGKPLVVNLWAPWCTPCIREMPAFDKVHQDLGKRVTIVGITDGLDRAGAKRLAKSTRVTYPLLIDDGGNLQADLGVVNLPTTVFLDADGKVIRRHAGAFTAESLRKTIDSLYDLD